MAKYSLRSSTLRQRGRNEMKNSSGEVKLQQRQSPRLKAKRRLAAMEKRVKKRNALKRKLAKAAKERSDELAKAAKERSDELVAKAAKEQRDALKHWKNEQLAAFTQAQREVYAAFKHAANEGDILEMAKLWRPLHIDLRFRYVGYDMTTWVEQQQWNQMCDMRRRWRSAFVPSGTN